jgi:acyl carrier protein
MVSRVAPQPSSDADKVRRLISKYVSIDVKHVTDDAHLIDDLGLDWLDQLELLVLIEDEFAGVVRRCRCRTGRRSHPAGRAT